MHSYEQSDLGLDCIAILSFLSGNCIFFFTRPRSAVGIVSGNRCESDCRSRGEFDPGPIPYFRGD